MRKPLITAWLVAGLCGAAAAQVPDPQQLERRLRSVATLIETSSAARQIESSGERAALGKRDSARLMQREAGVLLRAGDSAAAARLLEQATREMMDGVRLAKPEQVTGAKARRDYEARLDSVRALLDAQRRISQEKGATADATEAARSIEQQMAQAQRLAAAGDFDDARQMIDRAYLTARVSIETLRRGDTLVRSLDFASKREEYAYEIDRNDTHRMLITVLLADRKEGPGAMPAAMQAFVDRSAALRREAEAQAADGDHARAVRTLEDATRELVRAIRSGGLYIPG